MIYTYKLFSETHYTTESKEVSCYSLYVDCHVNGAEGVVSASFYSY